LYVSLRWSIMTSCLSLQFKYMMFHLFICIFHVVLLSIFWKS